MLHLSLTGCVRLCADGMSGITGALAALAQSFTNLQKSESDCGLKLGWDNKNAPRGNPRARNNIALCAKTGRK